jgi:hypothetical protein
MATLQSPGVSVSVIDQSFYTPAGTGTVPLIFVATGANKNNASSTGIAQGTTSANAGKVYVITSQRDLVDTFGTPYFEVDSGKNAINGSEISEYGLQAAYSVLGISSRAFVVRADIDLTALIGTSTIPTGTPPNGTFWLDTSSSTQFGINVWNTSLNGGLGGFVNTPVDIIDSSNSTKYNNNFPVPSFGMVGDYAMYVPDVTENSIPSTTIASSQLFYKSSTNGWVKVTDTFDSGKRLQISEHFNYPTFNASTATGSVWVCDTPIPIGASWNLKYYNSDTGQWTLVNAPQYGSRQEAIAGLDSNRGGLGITQNSTFVLYDYNGVGNADFRILTRENVGATTVSITSATTYQASPINFYIRETSNTGSWRTSVKIDISPTGTTALGQAIANAINTNSNFTQVSASYVSGTLTFTHASGGEIELADGDADPLNYLGMNVSRVGEGKINNLYLAPSTDVLNAGKTTVQASNWAPLTYYSKSVAPNSYPASNKIWYDTRTNEVDILWNTGSKWVGYRTQFPNTDPAGPLVQASAPTKQSNGTTPLVTGDIWIDRSNPDMYGQLVYVYNGTSKQWVKQDVTDHISPTGWVFADARWGDTGARDMEYITPISTLLVSNYLDFDAPNPALYPRGTRLWNTRRSGNTVKQYFTNYVNINSTNPYSDPAVNELQTSYAPDRWVTVSGHNSHNVANFGRLAQRSMVVAALKSSVTTNTSVRDTDTLNYNLIATPGYTELVPDMITLNQDIGQLAFIIGDTPLRLEPNATTLQNYGNGNGATVNGEQGLIASDSYLGVYYPSGYTNDNYGRNIVVPPSHMMLRVLVNNDNVSYPWFAPAGTNRGIVNNASSVGYVDEITAEFKPVSLYQGLRDVLSTVEINPIATLPGSGLTVMGQYTRTGNSTSLNRVNVARLVNYIRRQLNILSKPFLFEPNDSQTRNEIKRVIEGLMHELVSQRGLYDYVVVCDTSNNTPTRIDQNQLWVDIAIEPVKSVEFIYIPLRLLNTGAIKSGNFGSAFPGSKNSS